VAELEQHEATLDQVSQRIAGLEDVHLAVIRTPEPTSAPERPEALPEFQVVQDEPQAMASSELSIDALAPTEPPASEADDLLSIFDEADQRDQAAPPEAPPAAFQGEQTLHDRSAPDTGPRTPGFGPLSFTPKGDAPEVGGPARPAVPSLTPPIGMPGLDQSPRFVRPASERGSELVELPPERTERFRVIPDPEPVIPEVASGEAPEANARSLRCGECGAMNRPLEWYCEKCGAELTAV
jgi:hypothetical protein